MRGVGFLAHKSIRDNIIKFKSTSDRVTSLTKNINQRCRRQIIQVYSHTKGYEDEEVENCYEETDQGIDNSESHYKVIMFNFNA